MCLPERTLFTPLESRAALQLLERRHGFSPPRAHLLRRRIVATLDAKVMNAYSYKIAREDHTLGHLMRMCVRLLRRLHSRAVLWSVAVSADAAAYY